MTLIREPAERQIGTINDSRRDRRPYTPPAIEEEVAIENIAMGCNSTGKCGSPSTSG